MTFQDLTSEVAVPLTTLASAPAPIQTGPNYRCFLCGAPARGLRWWPLGGGASPLDELAAHIAYLVPGCTCHLRHVGCTRVAVMDGAITPLAFAGIDELPGFEVRTLCNVQAVFAALEVLNAAVVK